MLKRVTTGRSPVASVDGQALTEFALVAPLFFMVLFGIITLGIGVFYQQQVTNAAREASRYAAVHSATARCPTVSNLAPDVALLPLPHSYSECDAPDERWPFMTAAARSHLFGLPSTEVQFTACWSGYWTKDTNGAWAAHDEIAVNPDGTHNEFRECTVRVFGWCSGASGASTLHVINPRTSVDPTCPDPDDKTVRVDCSRPFPLTTAGDDMASSYAKSDGRNANQVTVMSCYPWRPPLAGFLLIPGTVDLIGVVTETLEYQQ
jgi:hypothetical protein